MKQGDICKTGGQYCCLYHLKSKIKVRTGVAFPDCNYGGLNCEGTWHLVKVIKEKTHEEMKAANNAKRYNLRKRRKRRAGYDDEYIAEKVKWDDWKQW